jgi:hypothetical protein
MDVAVIAGLLVLAGAGVSAGVPRGHRWLAILGMAGAAVTAIVLSLTGYYEGFEGPAWLAFAVLVVYFGGGWSLGIAVGYLMREWLGRRREGLR